MENVARKKTESELYNEAAQAYKSPYELWKEAEGLPTLRGLAVPSLYDVELHSMGVTRRLRRIY